MTEGCARRAIESLSWGRAEKSITRTRRSARRLRSHRPELLDAIHWMNPQTTLSPVCRDCPARTGRTA